MFTGIITISGESPANVQGGLLAGGILMRLWVPVSESVAVGVASGCPSLVWLHFVMPLLLLIHPLGVESRTFLCVCKITQSHCN